MTETTVETDMYDDYDFDGSLGIDAMNARKNASFDRSEYLKIDGSQQAVDSGKNYQIVRFLTDWKSREPEQRPTRWNIPWVTVDQHTNIETKPKPESWGDKAWPARMGAVCRNDKIFKRKYEPGSCWICNNKVTGTGKERKGNSYPRQWALAVLVEEIVGTQDMVTQGIIPPNMIGAVIGFRDKTKDVLKVGADGQPTSEVTKVPEFVKINMGVKNFFSQLEGIARYYGTIVDRDYRIARMGMDTNTTYNIMAMEPRRNPDGTVYDLRSVEALKAAYPTLPDLMEIIVDQASDDYYNRFFIPGAPDSGASQAAAASNGTAYTPPVQTNEPTEAMKLAMAERLKGYSPQAAS